MLALLIVALALLQPVSGQPGQWKAINPVFANLNDVWMISSTQGWAVGDSPGAGLPGIAIYWDGAQWRQILTPTLAAVYNLESAGCLSANNCIAVGTGTGPILLQWDGISWIDRSALVAALGTTALHSIYIRSDGLGFAVGESIAGKPNIVRVNVAASPPTVTSEAIVGAPDRLRSVWILPPGTAGSIQGFAVGDNGAAAGAGWRWDGTPGGWLLSSPGAVGRLYGVYVVDPNDAIAVGTSDARTRWNGATWTPEGGAVIATTNWRAVYAIASNDEWMVGSAVSGVASIAHWDGVSWSAFAPPNVPVAVDLYSVHMLSSSDGWAVGAGGAIIHWDGSSWNSVASPVASPNDLWGVWLASSADGWAVGEAFPPTLGQIFRWNGANWNLYQTSPVASGLNAIHGSASTNVFAVGNDPDGAGAAPPAIVRWTGGLAWVNISPAGVANNVDLLGVFALSPSLAFAVGAPPGAAPATMLRWDGTIWASIPSGTANGVFLESIWMVSSTDGWAVGSGGTIVRWNGAAWAAETSPTGATLWAVQALTSTNVWAVGSGGTIIHRDGTGWTVVPSGVLQSLNSLYMLSPTEGWAVGSSDGTSPVILFWDGSTWTRVYPVPLVNRYLLDVWMVASTDGWAVGQNGLILRLGPGPVTTVTATVTATATTTQSATATSTVTTSTVSTQVTSTQTSTGTTTTYSTVTSTTTIVTPMPAPIPGFPIESILAGLFAGAAGLFVFRRRRRT
jgi:hypothetical protein